MRVCDPCATPFHIKNDTVVTEAKGRLELGVGVPLMIPGPATHTRMGLDAKERIVWKQTHPKP